MKTAHGERVIALDRDTITDLTGYLRQRDTWRKTAGTDWPDTVRMPSPDRAATSAFIHVDLLFRRPDGRAWHPNQIGLRFCATARAAGLPPIRLHDARHCAATYTLAAGGTLANVKDLLGHSTIVLAGNVYGSVLLDDQRTLADRTARLLRRQPTTARRTNRHRAGGGQPSEGIRGPRVKWRSFSTGIPLTRTNAFG